MGRDSNKERNSWLLRPKPRTLGDAMQRGAGEGQDAQQTDWQQLPELPKWPPLPEEDPFASARPTGETGEMAAAGGLDSSEQQTAPPWIPAPPDGQARPGRPSRTLWRRFQGLSRRSRLVFLVAAVSVIVLVCTLVSVAALGGGLLASTTGAARNTPAGQTSGGQAGAPTAGGATPTAAVSPTATGEAETPTAAALTLAFTCASGSIGGTGQVCVHTLPNASVSLSVRYCDGNNAKGSGLRGAAHANSNGDYTWRWKVTTHCAGAATATVTAKSSGQTVIQSTTFTITR